MNPQDTAVAGTAAASPDPLLADTAAAARADASDPHLPEALGEFRVLGLLGRGGMGAVYLAEQQQPQREVALKVLRGAHDDPDSLRRFQLEGEALALLDHPNIAHVFATGVDDRHGARVPFLAMELVRGRNLLADADARGLDAEARVRLMLDVCAGVQHAHQRGVIHRDLKPANILVDGDGRPKIMDFGIARIVHDGGDAATRLTEAGQVVGTIPYMSPEQLRGETRRIDVRTDVFALGVILYELLAGRRPRELDASSLFSAIKSAERTSMVPLAKIAPKFGGDLDTIVMKALAEAPSQRYASVGELAADLERYLDHRPILARAPSAFYIARKFARRHRALVAAAAIAVLALLAATAFALVSAQKERAAREQAERNAAIAESVSGFMNAMFAAALPEEALGREISVKELVQQATRSFEVSPPRNIAVEVAIADQLAQVHLALGDYDRAEKLVEGTLAKLSGKDHEAERNLLDLKRIAVMSNRGQHAEIEAESRAMIARMEKMSSPDDLTIAQLRSLLGAALVNQSRFDEGIAEFQKISALPDLPGDDDNDVREGAIGDIGSSLHSAGRYREAEAVLEPHIEFLRRTRGELYVGTLKSMLNLATSKQLLGKTEEATRLFATVYEGRKRVLGEGHPETLTALQNQATIMVTAGRQDEAIPLLRAVIEQTRKSRGPTHQHVLIAMNVLAYALDDLNRLDEAEQLYREILQLRRDAGLADVETFGTQNNLAMLLMKRGILEGAETEFRSLLDEARGKLGDGHVYVHLFANNLGECLTKQHRYDEALELLRTSHAGLVATFGEEHDRVKKSQARMDAALKAQAED